MNPTYCPACLKPLVGTLSCTCSNAYDRIRKRVTPETRQRVKDQMIDLMNAAPVYIGVDPAFRKDGFWCAIVDMNDRTVSYLKFSDVLDFHDYLRTPPGFSANTFICVENSNMQNKSFDTSGNRAETARKGRNVGTNQAVSELAYISACRVFGDRAFQVSPKEKGAKWTEQQAGNVLKSERLTVATKGNNQDCRDALKLALIAAKRALWNGAFKVAQR